MRGIVLLRKGAQRKENGRQPFLPMLKRPSHLLFVIVCVVSLLTAACELAAAPGQEATPVGASVRERLLFNEGWRFFKEPAQGLSPQLSYDVRPEVAESLDGRPADAKPTEAVRLASDSRVLKRWILPTGNLFLKDPARRHVRPAGHPGADFPFVQTHFDDSAWESVQLPHDWAIRGPFQEGPKALIGGGMGRLPINGVAWYRKQFSLSSEDAGKSLFLDVDGAMSYAAVWINGKLAGGWPYGYSSWRVDLTPHLNFGAVNQLAIHLDNPPSSSRWYPGAGLYRNVWLCKTAPIHVAQWGTQLTTHEVSEKSAEIRLRITVDNDSKEEVTVRSHTRVYCLDSKGEKTGGEVSAIETQAAVIPQGGSSVLSGAVVLKNPRLWGPVPTQKPNRYVAVTSILKDGREVDRYETRFGIRDLRFDPQTGVWVNGEWIKLKGVNQHHDLGALGAAFNLRAAERQLEVLLEMGCNAVRMSHNPPAPELLELTDRLGLLVMNESFDCWERKKTPLDFHLIFPDWHEQDLRALIRRDRNHPSVIMWSVGNEVGEQYTDAEGAAVARRLCEITREEDPTRPTTSAMNFAKPHMPLPAELDVISLNYQGEGIRQDPEFEGTDRIRTPPSYQPFHEALPGKMILSSETASAFSSRGVYLFPVSKQLSAPVRDGRGGDSSIHQVSAYELHAVDFGSTAEKVFDTLERHPFVAGEFVWTGWDHLGEPTPYYEARSSYCGIIDMAGFKKDRFYLYQSHWRPELPMVHLLPHWTWPERLGQVTPVHVFTSGDEAELFLNGISLGRKSKKRPEYRLRWDEVRYEPGELKVVAYKQGVPWAEEVVRTAGEPAKLELSADRGTIAADGVDLSFVTVRVTDEHGTTAPRASNSIQFSLTGPGEIVATDNGDPTSFEPLQGRPQRKCFNGYCLVIVKGRVGIPGTLTLTATAEGLQAASVEIGTR